MPWHWSEVCWTEASQTLAGRVSPGRSSSWSLGLPHRPLSEESRVVEVLGMGSRLPLGDLLQLTSKAELPSGDSLPSWCWRTGDASELGLQLTVLACPRRLPAPRVELRPTAASGLPPLLVGCIPGSDERPEGCPGSGLPGGAASCDARGTWTAVSSASGSLQRGGRPH